MEIYRITQDNGLDIPTLIQECLGDRTDRFQSHLTLELQKLEAEMKGGEQVEGATAPEAAPEPAVAAGDGGASANNLAVLRARMNQLQSKPLQSASSQLLDAAATPGVVGVSSGSTHSSSSFAPGALSALCAAAPDYQPAFVKAASPVVAAPPLPAADAPGSVAAAAPGAAEQPGAGGAFNIAALKSRMNARQHEQEP
jgi:hypothetical protein